VLGNALDRAVLRRGLHFSPNVLDKLIYSEVSAFSGGSWAYDPAARHDVPVVQLAQPHRIRTGRNVCADYAAAHRRSLDALCGGSTMTLSDLFDWSRESILSNLAGQSGVVRRSLQVRFAKRLAICGFRRTAARPATRSDGAASIVYLESATARR